MPLRGRIASKAKPFLHPPPPLIRGFSGSTARQGGLLLQPEVTLLTQASWLLHP